MIDSVIMGSKPCGPGRRPLLLAEEGQANNGDHAFALRMIDIAAEAGADIIEFQLGLADDLYIQDDPGHEIYRRREFTADQIHALVEAAHAHGMAFQAACLSASLVSVCASAGTDSFCVNAMDIDNPTMLGAVTESGKPFWLATLMSTLADVDWAVEHVRGHGATSFGLLHGQHIMTSGHDMDMPPEVMQLDCIDMFKCRYGVPVGYIDHTSAVETPTLAYMKGACLVCKHLAPKPGWRGPDWAVALEPEKWKQARCLLDRASLMGGATKEVGSLEAVDQPLHRRSLRVRRAIVAGEVVGADDVVALRPGGGLSPRFTDHVVGRKVKRPLKKHEVLFLEDMENS